LRAPDADARAKLRETLIADLLRAARMASKSR
jgi:hypothetical protein